MLMLLRPTAALAAAAAVLTFAAPTGAGAATEPPALRSVLGTVPRYIQDVKDLGATAELTPVRAMIALRQRDEAGLDAFIAAVSDPSSSRYGDYLSPAEFERRFAPTDASVDAVSRAVRAAGLRVTDVPRNNAYVMVSGTAGQAQRLFHTTLRDYRLRGATVHAPATAVKLPSALAELVVDVKGLDTGDVAQHRADPPPAFVNAPPCSTAWGDSTSSAPIPDGFTAPLPNVPCGYTPQQLQGAYGTKAAIAAGLDGTGQRVAIIDAFSSPRIVSDVTTWSQKHGLPAPKIEVYDNFLQRNTPQGLVLPILDLPPVGFGILDPHGWAGEQTLDVEAVHAMAPGATIVYQGANTALNMDLNTAQNNVVSKKLAQIISNSYGGTTDDLDPTSDNIWRQAAAEGIGVYFSSGDNGDETAGTGDTKRKTVDAGGNSSFVTSVGGTTLAIGPKDDYLFETYWGTFTSTLKDGKFDKPVYNAGGGGGTSQAYAQPDYQKGVVPDQFASFWKGSPDAVKGGQIPGRVTPDVAMVGDANSGFLMGMVQDHTAYRNLGGNTFPGDDLHYSEYRIGGTSLASPLFAGMMALADQAAGKPHGFANPALYAARTANAFHDISSPTKPVAVIRTNYVNSTNAEGGMETLLRTADNLASLKSVPGYDDSTGLGSPQGLPFLRALAPGSKLIPADPVTCRLRSLRFSLGGARKRVESVQVRVGGKVTLTRRGHRLTAVTVRFPEGKTHFTVAIRTRTASGRIATSTRRFTESGCKRSKVTVKRTTAKRG
jgi:subtilase family serine protease